MSTAEQHFTAVRKEPRWECKICRKDFQS